MADDNSPPFSIEDATRKNIALAMSQAESELKTKSASSQIVKHFLELGSVLYKLRVQEATLRNSLIEAKIRQIEEGESTAEMFAEVLESLKEYSGNGHL